MAGTPPVANSIVVTTNTTTSQIVMCQNGVDVKAMVKEFGLAPTFIYKYVFNGFAAPMDAATITTLKQDSRIQSVDMDSPVTLCDQTNSTGFARLGIARFPVAHINGTNEPLNVDVAVLDTGIDPNQPDLNIYTNFSAYESDGSDQIGHGTAVAGVLCAEDNGYGVVGVAPGVRLWNVQCTGNPPFNSWSFALGGMEFVAQNANQISVVNISFINTTTAPWQSIQTAMENLVQAGVVVVAAAGNSTEDLAGPDGVYGSNDDAVPAALPQAMAVSGMDSSLDTNGVSRDIFYTLSNFSEIPRTNNPRIGITNFVFSPGGAIDVAAPAVNILTTGTNGTYITTSGTSFAAPHVAGLVALYIAANGRATNAAGVYAIRQAIINNSLPQSQWMPAGKLFDPINNPTGDPDTNPEPLAMPSENWVPKPFITNAVNTPSGFQAGFSAVPGDNYTLQSSSILTSPASWTNLSTITGSGDLAPVVLTDTNLSGQGFYRLLRQPAP
jgi:subtilisin